MKYKKMIALIAAAGMIGTLGGCGLKAPEKPSQAPSGETEQAPKETPLKNPLLTVVLPLFMQR